MFLVTLVLILSTALLFFYFQVVCQKILRRPFDQDYFRSVVNAIRLEFPSVRVALETSGAPIEYTQASTKLKCDLLMLDPMLKDAAHSSRQFLREVRLLRLCFRLTSASLVIRHMLGLRETPAFLKLTAILEYFANVVGQQANASG